MEGVNTYRPAREGKCLDEKKTKQNKNNTQNIKYDTQTRTLVASRLWAERGVGRTKLNNDKKATALRLR